MHSDWYRLLLPGCHNTEPERPWLVTARLLLASEVNATMLTGIAEAPAISLYHRYSATGRQSAGMTSNLTCLNGRHSIRSSWSLNPATQSIFTYQGAPEVGGLANNTM